MCECHKKSGSQYLGNKESFWGSVGVKATGFSVPFTHKGYLVNETNHDGSSEISENAFFNLYLGNKSYQRTVGGKTTGFSVPFHIYKLGNYA